MTDARTVAEVAGRLTKAQREALLGGAGEWTFTGKATVHSSRAKSLVLYHPELAEHAFIKKSERAHYGKGAFRLTPLGLAVKAHLLDQESAQ